MRKWRSSISHPHQNKRRGNLVRVVRWGCRQSQSVCVSVQIWVWVLHVSTHYEWVGWVTSRTTDTEDLVGITDNGIVLNLLTARCLRGKPHWFFPVIPKPEQRGAGSSLCCARYLGVPSLNAWISTPSDLTSCVFLTSPLSWGYLRWRTEWRHFQWFDTTYTLIFSICRDSDGDGPEQPSAQRHFFRAIP